MPITLTEATTEVRYHIKRTTGGYADSRIATRLNWSLDKIVDSNDFSEMALRATGSFTDGLKTYTLPTRFNHPISLTLQDSTNSRQLTFLPRNLFESQVPYPESQPEGRPSVYVVDATTFEVFSIPDTTYSYAFWYYQRHVAWSGSNETLFVGKDRLIVAFATHLCALDLQEKELSEYWLNESNLLFREAIENEKNKLRDYIPRAQPFGTGGGFIIGTPEASPFVKSW